MSRSRLEPFFLETSAGRIFLLLRAPLHADRCVLFVPPFGEEMNKCRRQMAETAQMLVTAGYAVLTVDLFGTGDSGGDFAEARWEGWKDNVVSALSWTAGKGLSIEGAVATRLGCILLAEGLQQAECSVARTAFWQPVESGRQFMTQFLRLRVAVSMMAADGKETVDGLRARLAEGEIVEVAGYPLASDLWRAVERADLAPALNTHLGKLAVLEVGRAREDGLSIAGQRLVAAASALGIRAQGSRIAGEPFWSSTEIVTSPELTRRTVEFFADTPS